MLSPFKKEIKVDIVEPLETYIDIALLALKRNGISDEFANTYVSKIVREGYKPMVEYYERDRLGDPVLTKSDVGSYLTDYKRKNEVMVGTLTTFSKKKVALYPDMTIELVNKRNLKKIEAKSYEKKGLHMKFRIANSFQGGLKTLNNLGSGAAAAAGTVFRNRIGHNTLTVTTRTYTSAGNIFTESFLGGNKYWKTIDDVTVNVYFLLSKMSPDEVRRTLIRYDLREVTLTEAKDAIIHTLKRYRCYEYVSYDELSFMDNLNGLELTFITYHNDFYHVKKYNKDWFVSMMRAATKTDIIYNIDHFKEISEAPEWLEMCVRIARKEILIGSFIPYNEMDKSLIEDLGSYAYRTRKFLEWFKMFMDTFFLTDMMPAGAHNVWNMLKDVIGLSDTDSTSGSQNGMIKDIVNRNDRLSSEDYGPSALLVTILSEIFQHYIDVISTVMNIQKEHMSRLTYKNEFVFTYMLVTFKTKHYIASTAIKEGFAFPKNKLDIKGVHLKSSKVTMKYLNIGYNLMNFITKTVESGNGFKLEELLLLGHEVEERIIKQIESGDIDLFKRNQIKTHNTYADGVNSHNYKQYLMWKEVFQEKYPVTLEFPLMTRSINLKLDKAKDFEFFLNNIKDKKLKERFITYCEKVGRKKLGVIQIPNEALNKYGLIKEFRNELDMEVVLGGSIKNFIIILNTMGARKVRGYGWLGAHPYIDFSKIKSNLNEIIDF